MPGHGDSLFPIFGAGGVDSPHGGPWFNWQGLRVECEFIDWTAPDSRVLRVYIKLLCPRCEHPMIMKAQEGIYLCDDEGALTIKPLIQCPGHWWQVDANGRPMVGGQRIQCGWVGQVVAGVAHHPRCESLRNGGNVSFCNCGAVAPSSRG